MPDEIDLSGYMDDAVSPRPPEGADAERLLVDAQRLRATAAVLAKLPKGPERHELERRYRSWRRDFLDEMAGERGLWAVGFTWPGKLRVQFKTGERDSISIEFTDA